MTEKPRIAARLVARPLALETIRESKTNPRRAFDPAALAELTESVRLHGVLQPILVRGTLGKGYEVVAGARRFRAAIAAGLEEIPAVIRELTPVEALEIQVIENLQREDLHPLDEADGYHTLHATHGYTIDALAAKVGKSKAYVYARLKLCSLSKVAAKLFLEGELDASRALLVARIPVAKLQDQAAKEIAGKGSRWRGPMSYREAVDHVRRDFMLELKAAPFAIADAELVPAAGACKACPKRTGNARDLFADVKSGDVCTDPKCFAAKRDAHFVRLRAVEAAAGRKVLEGQAAARAITGAGGGYVRLDRACYDDPRFREWGALLKKAKDLPVVQAIHKGELVPVVPIKAARSALEACGHKFRSSSSSSRGQSAEETRRVRAHRVRLATVDAMVEQLVAKAEASKNRKAFARLVAAALLRGHADTVKAVAKRREIPELKEAWAPRRRAIAGVLDGMTEVELRGLIVELVAIDQVSSTWSGGWGEGWLEACRAFGIKYQAKERALAAAARKPKAKAKRRASR